jgi:hypothetical protein
MAAEADMAIYLLGLGNAPHAGRRPFDGNDPAAVIRFLGHRGGRVLPAPQADLYTENLILAGATACPRFSTPTAWLKNPPRCIRGTDILIDVRNAIKKRAPGIGAIELVYAIAWDLE